MVASLATVSLCGCGDSTSTPSGASSPNSAASTPPARGTPAPPVAPATPVTPATPTASAAPVVPARPVAPAAVPATPITPAPAASQPASVPAAIIQPAANDTVSLITKFASTQTDRVLSSLGTDLAGKVKSLGESLGANSAVKAQVDKAVQSLVSGKDAEALSAITQVAPAGSLTPTQLQLAKETGNLLSAIVVQRNFSSLEGAQGDVATIVNSLRKGEFMAAVPAIQKVASNANLTPPQKQLIGSLADKYAPGVKQAADTLQQSLKKIPGLK
jgi:hypothetical protein